MDWKDALVLPSFIVSLFAFLVSGWTAVQLGKIEFERRRQELLSRARSLEVLRDERADAWGRLVSRLDALDPEVVDRHLIERWGELKQRLESTQKAIATGLPDRAMFLKSIETMPNGLSQRVSLEAAIGEEDRILASFRMVGWDAEFSRDADAVVSVEAAFATYR